MKCHQLTNVYKLVEIEFLMSKHAMMEIERMEMDAHFIVKYKMDTSVTKNSFLIWDTTQFKLVCTKF
jgi:hypothetical protein